MTDGSPPAATDDDAEPDHGAVAALGDGDAAQHASADVAPELFGW